VIYNVILNIIEQPAGMLWVVTKKGIDKINIQNKQIERYNQVYNENVLASTTRHNLYYFQKGIWSSIKGISEGIGKEYWGSELESHSPDTVKNILQLNIGLKSITYKIYPYKIISCCPLRVVPEYCSYMYFKLVSARVLPVIGFLCNT